MIDQQPKSLVTNLYAALAKEKHTETDQSIEDFLESEAQATISPKKIENEAKNKIQSDGECCRDCNSINCPHCDCSFW